MSNRSFQLIIFMLRYEQFQETIIKQLGAEAEEWKHLLPVIPVALRHRFLSTTQKGFGVADSFDMVMLSQKMLDADYDAFVQDALAKKLASKKVPGGTKQSTE